MIPEPSPDIQMSDCTFLLSLNVLRININIVAEENVRCIIYDNQHQIVLIFEHKTKLKERKC